MTRFTLTVACKICECRPFTTMKFAQRHMFRVHKIRGKPEMREKMEVRRTVYERGDFGPLGSF